jgi:phospholipase C
MFAECIRVESEGKGWRPVIHFRFIEDHWLGGQRIGQGSFDSIASSIDQMFDFDQPRDKDRLMLDPATGEPTQDE